MLKKIKLGLIDQKNNFGGGERFTLKILSNFSDFNNDLEIDYYGLNNFIQRKKLNTTFPKLKFKSFRALELRHKGIFKISKSNKIISKLQDKLKKYTTYFPSYISGNLKKEMEKKLKDYDVVLFLWPYNLECPNIKARKIIILHDLNFKYYFSGQSTFNLTNINNLNNYIDNWLKTSDVILTSRFMAKEFKKFYPNFKNRIKIIRVGHLGGNVNKPENKFKFIKSPFILCPSSTLGHKNISSLMRAFSIIRKKNKSIKLVFTGPGTEVLNGIYLNNQLQLQKKNQSIYGLGHIENDEIDYLIKKAKIVINCSLYEPGNGSGLDAWEIGTPVAMSNIPAFKEHIKYLGVIAQIFDPLDASDISKKINKILKYKKNVKEKIIKISRDGMKKISWDLIIKQYINFIKQ